MGSIRLWFVVKLLFFCVFGFSKAELLSSSIYSFGISPEELYYLSFFFYFVLFFLLIQLLRKCLTSLII